MLLFIILTEDSSEENLQLTEGSGMITIGIVLMILTIGVLFIALGFSNKRGNIVVSIAISVAGISVVMVILGQTSTETKVDAYRSAMSQGIVLSEIDGNKVTVIDESCSLRARVEGKEDDKAITLEASNGGDAQPLTPESVATICRALE